MPGPLGVHREAEPACPSHYDASGAIKSRDFVEGDA
jgi:hypothetical protein